MKTQEIISIITTTISTNFPSLLAIIGVGSGVKIVFDVIFKSLFTITNSKD